MELYRATRNAPATALVSVNSNVPTPSRNRNTRQMVGLHQASKTQMDAYRRQIMQLQQHQQRQQASHITPPSGPVPLVAPASQQPGWRSRVLQGLVSRMKQSSAGPSSTSGSAFPPPTYDPVVVQELEQSLTQVLVRAGERLFGLDPVELQNSPGLRQMVHDHMNHWKFAPNWIKFGGSLACKRLAHWIRPQPSSALESVVLDLPQAVDMGQPLTIPVTVATLDIPEPANKKRRITKAIQNAIQMRSSDSGDGLDYAQLHSSSSSTEESKTEIQSVPPPKKVRRPATPVSTTSRTSKTSKVPVPAKMKVSETKSKKEGQNSKTKPPVDVSVPLSHQHEETEKVSEENREPSLIVVDDNAIHSVHEHS